MRAKKNQNKSCAEKVVLCAMQHSEIWDSSHLIQPPKHILGQKKLAAAQGLVQGSLVNRQWCLKNSVKIFFVVFNFGFSGGLVWLLFPPKSDHFWIDKVYDRPVTFSGWRQKP